jgi:hypothetical protein
MESNDRSWTFDGFSSPNFTPVPDEFFDHVAPRLNGGEVKLALYMIRRTFGFKKDNDNISLSQMLKGIVRSDGRRLDHGVGISKEPLIRALKSLEQKNVIYRVKQWDARGACVATNYRLNVKDYTPGLESNQGVSEPPGGPGLKSNQGLVQKPTGGLVGNPTTQYTVNKKQLNKNVNVSKRAGRRNPLHDLADIDQHRKLTSLIAEDIVRQLGDEHSRPFYQLVARKVPESFIRRILSELKQGSAKSPAKVFSSEMVAYARERGASASGADLAKKRQVLVNRFTQT